MFHKIWGILLFFENYVNTHEVLIGEILWLSCHTASGASFHPSDFFKPVITDIISDIIGKSTEAPFPFVIVLCRTLLKNTLISVWTS